MSSAAGASAVLSFDYYYKLDDVDAEMQVQYSCNGGGNWTVFPNGTFDDTGGTTVSFSEDIPCTTANTQIRFISTGAKKNKSSVPTMSISVGKCPPRRTPRPSSRARTWPAS